MVSSNRRRVLKAASGIGIGALAGCLGGGGGDGGATSLSVGIPSASTTTGAASNSFQRVVKNQSGDTEPAGEIRWQNQETGGDPPSLRQFSQGNVQALSAGNFIVASAQEDLPPFQERPLDTLPNQMFSITPLHMHILSVQGSGVQTSDDLVGSNFWPLPPQWGLRQQAETVLSNAGLWSELQDSDSIVDAGTGDVAGLIEEGNIDAMMGYGAGFTNLAGWATEVDARADLQLVEFSDSLVEAANNTRGTSHSEIDTYGWEQQSFDANQMDVYGADFQFWLGSGVSRDVGYELARISNEHTESIQEGQPAYLDHSDPENMASLYLEDVPVHPGPYDFLEEQGVDMSAYTRGGE
ncbi:TAXI family TRAP transporter solute-binding subunit [Natrinema sp. 1APR25-10V2]|uniref:TAXI family TRAP transporter solute-binding subunit n=1 Tax=Natrinema sp. 1APR25-10V2 TaxID=2951081 RepID=UPI002875E245|nr:TAXI family TRAP transporter solute-binding subunit [Natrinema sp. 1APR25-10V2]MDS0473924.1 TRAP transporter substrate-binding protein [Natrinema sp. 1APR25-10V2]